MTWPGLASEVDIQNRYLTKQVSLLPDVGRLGVCADAKWYEVMMVNWFLFRVHNCCCCY